MSALAAELTRWHEDARARTHLLLDDLDGTAAMGPMLRIVNPPVWELGHVAWFHERWAWCHLRGFSPLRADSDALYDSATVEHDSRWHLPLPSFSETRAYAHTVLQRLGDRLVQTEPTPEEEYFHRLGVLHEDMHDEAFTYTRQTLGYAAPPLATVALPAADQMPTGDVAVPGGTFLLGARPETGFVFDNEKWAHSVTVEPYSIARTPVTNAEFAAFVDAGGYRRHEFWTAEGWAWRNSEGAEHPVYWRAAERNGWEQRVYNKWRPLPGDHPVIHVCWWEADAYCHWAGRRLPTEAEWEIAAAAEPGNAGRSLSAAKRRYPWGEAAPEPTHANLDSQHGGTVPVHTLPAGDSVFGCRQMIGNVWEWTSSIFGPYPGFVIDPYREYSAPWFRTHRVLRGGCWATRRRLIRNTWRNFYTADRRDVFGGFRTCAMEA